MSGHQSRPGSLRWADMEDDSDSDEFLASRTWWPASANTGGSDDVFSHFDVGVPADVGGSASDNSLTGFALIDWLVSQGNRDDTVMDIVEAQYSTWPKAAQLYFCQRVLEEWDLDQEQRESTADLIDSLLLARDGTVSI